MEQPCVLENNPPHREQGGLRNQADWLGVSADQPASDCVFQARSRLPKLCEYIKDENPFAYVLVRPYIWRSHLHNEAFVMAASALGDELVFETSSLLV